jgi:hypothetical protein
MVLKQQGHLSLPYFFGLIHPLIGSDILCSPRSFGPAWILKTCIDFNEFIFDPEKGIQKLVEEQPQLEGYTRYILSLYKKSFQTRSSRQQGRCLLTLQPPKMLSNKQDKTHGFTP